MSLHKWVVLVFGGLLTVSLFAVTGCASTPTAQPQALSGQVEKVETQERTNVRRHVYPGKQYRTYR